MNSLATIHILTWTNHILLIYNKVGFRKNQASIKGAGNDLNILAPRHEVEVASVYLAPWSLFCIGHL